MAESKSKAASGGEMPATRKSPSRRRRTSAGRHTALKSSARRSHPKRAGRGNGRGSGLLAKGRSALNDAYEWAGEAGASMPRAMRNMPSQRSIQSVIDEKPLLMGAVGLGIGVILGACLPSLQVRSNKGRIHRSSR